MSVSNTNILNLPQELILHIMESLDPSAIDNLCRSNPQIHQLCQNNNNIIKKFIKQQMERTIQKNNKDIFYSVCKSNGFGIQVCKEHSEHFINLLAKTFLKSGKITFTTPSEYIDLLSELIHNDIDILIKTFLQVFGNIFLEKDDEYVYLAQKQRTEAFIYELQLGNKKQAETWIKLGGFPSFLYPHVVFYAMTYSDQDFVNLIMEYGRKFGVDTNAFNHNSYYESDSEINSESDSESDSESNSESNPESNSESSEDEN